MNKKELVAIIADEDYETFYWYVHDYKANHRQPPPLDFRGVDLYECNLSGYPLVGADFSGANLQGTKFRGARLQSAVFTRANLRGADFRNAILLNASFESAFYDGANFYGAQLLPEEMKEELLKKLAESWQPTQALINDIFRV